MFLVIIPILAVVLIGLAAYVHPIFERVFHTYDELNNIVDENLQGIRVVKSFNREEHEDRKFGNISETIYNNFVRAEKILSFNAPTMNLCIYAALIVISWVGAQQIVASGNDPAFGLTTGDMTALVTYALQILMSMMMISMIFVMVIISRASAERICQVLNEISTVRDHENPVMEVKDGSIRIRSRDLPLLRQLRETRARRHRPEDRIRHDRRHRRRHRFRQVQPRAARTASV